jgi:hypothetical protein
LRIQEREKMSKEVVIDKLVIHQWEKVIHGGMDITCDYSECSHKIHDGDTYYVELYNDKEDHIESYCIECASFFMSQALNAFMGKVAD